VITDRDIAALCAGIYAYPGAAPVVWDYFDQGDDDGVCWALKRVEPINDHLLVYVNRLSDHLFVQSRWVAKRLDEPEFLWDRGLRIDPREAVAAKRRAAAAEGVDSLGKDAPRRNNR